MNWEYGGFYKKYDMTGDIALPSGIVRVMDLMENPVPSWAIDSDCIFVDPPGSNSAFKSYYTKNGISIAPELLNFNNKLMEVLDTVQWKNLFVEVFASNINYFQNVLPKYGTVAMYNNYYYNNRKNKCWILHVTRNNSNVEFIDGIDETKAIDLICKNVVDVKIYDPCMGRGTVGIKAHKNSKQFCGTELNPKRLAVLVDYFRGDKID